MSDPLDCPAFPSRLSSCWEPSCDETPIHGSGRRLEDRIPAGVVGMVMGVEDHIELPPVPAWQPGQACRGGAADISKPQDGDALRFHCLRLHHVTVSHGSRRHPSDAGAAPYSGRREYTMAGTGTYWVVTSVCDLIQQQRHMLCRVAPGEYLPFASASNGPPATLLWFRTATLAKKGNA